MRALIVIILSGCGGGAANQSGTIQGSTGSPTEAVMFWCAATQQCFTTEAECTRLGACSALKAAWCVPYYDDQRRFICGTNRATCMDHAAAFRNVSGECIEQRR